jgi:hypothetical protein
MAWNILQLAFAEVLLYMFRTASGSRPIPHVPPMKKSAFFAPDRNVRTNYYGVARTQADRNWLNLRVQWH